MKMMLLLLSMVILLLGCDGLLHRDLVKPFMPGVYYASWKTNFSVATDTLQIVPVNENGSGGYLIIRRMHAQFMNAAHQRTPEYAFVKWQGIYDARSKTLVVQPNGRVLRFDPVNKTLQMGVIVYKKL